MDFFFGLIPSLVFILVAGTLFLALNAVIASACEASKKVGTVESPGLVLHHARQAVYTYRYAEQMYFHNNSIGQDKG